MANSGFGPGRAGGAALNSACGRREQVVRSGPRPARGGMRPARRLTPTFTNGERLSMASTCGAAPGVRVERPVERRGQMEVGRTRRAHRSDGCPRRGSGRPTAKRVMPPSTPSSITMSAAPDAELRARLGSVVDLDHERGPTRAAPRRRSAPSSGAPPAGCRRAAPVVATAADVVVRRGAASFLSPPHAANRPAARTTAAASASQLAQRRRCARRAAGGC